VSRSGRDRHDRRNHEHHRRCHAARTGPARPDRRLLGDQLDARRDEFRATLPIGRVVGPADVAALAVHLMTNTALTGATHDIDGGQQFV
jgi:NAD(P)-dependent dehydrogenase (short-subunit alcohol dehydrogenase family)